MRPVPVASTRLARAWLPRAAGVLGVGAVAAAIAVVVATRRWRSATERLVQQLVGAAGVSHGTVSFPALDALPDPVRRYFRAVLRDGQPRIRMARLRQAGTFRSKETADTAAGWQPFSATHMATVEPPGFVWDARIRVAPLTSVRVRDGYVAGRASMLGEALGLVPVVEAPDSPALREGVLYRHLAESVWYPTALLPSERLRWTAIGESHARATLSDRGTSVALDFEFAPTGEIVAAFTPGRRRAGPDGGKRELPWGGRYRRYESRGGMRVPLESEVYWVVDGREQPYYRGRNLEVEYDFGDGVSR